MLTKGAIHLVHQKGGQFLSHLFLVPKKDGEKRPVINLKTLNSFNPYSHFKMEGLHLLKNLLRKLFYVQGGIERCLLLQHFAQKSSKISSISMEWKHLQVLVSIFRSGFTKLCLCFGLIFTKTLKIPIAILRGIQIRIIIYLDDILLMSQTINGLERTRDTSIFLLQSLGFIINLQKSVLMPLQKIEFLGCNWTRTHNHLVHKRALNHLAKLAYLAKWLNVRL